MNNNLWKAVLNGYISIDEAEELEEYENSIDRVRY